MFLIQHKYNQPLLTCQICIELRHLQTQSEGHTTINSSPFLVDHPGHLMTRQQPISGGGQQSEIKQTSRSFTYTIFVSCLFVRGLICLFEYGLEYLIETGTSVGGVEYPGQVLVFKPIPLDPGQISASVCRAFFCR